MADQEVVIVIKGRNLSGPEFAEARKQIVGLKDNAEGASRGMSGFGSIIKTAIGTFGGFISAQAVMSGVSSAFSFAKGAALDMNASLEKSTLQFTTLMGDSQRAEGHVRNLFEFAKRTPFETGPIIEASRRMQTFGGNALNTMDNLTLLGDAAAATGAPIEDLGFWVGRMFAALKGGQPIGEATMRLMELGVLTPQTRVQMEGLAKSAGGGEKAFKLFQDSLGGFSGAMVAQANTWGGLMSSISDAINITLADALKPFFDTVKTGAQLILQALGSEGTQRVFADLKTQLTQVFGGDGQGLVKGMASGLLTFGSVALSVGDVIGRAWSGLKAVFAAVGLAVTFVVEAVATNISRVLDVAEDVPGIGDKFRGMATTMRDVAVQLNGIRTSFQEQTAEAWEGVQGNTAFSQAISAGRAALEGMHAELAKATVGTDAQTSALNRGRPAQETFVALTKEQEKAQKKDAEAAKARAEALEEFTRALKNQEVATWAREVAKAADESARFDEELEPLASSAHLVQQQLDGSWRVMNLYAEATGTATRETGLFRGVIDGLGDTIVRAFQGGGNVFKSIASFIGRNIGENVVKEFGAAFKDTALGKILADVLPGVGALLGPAVDKVVGGFKKLFGIGVNDEVKKWNAEIDKLRQGLLGSHGDLDKLEAAANRVGLSFKANWGHQNLAGFNAFKDLLGDFEDRTERLNAATQKYGLTWRDLNDAAQRSNLVEISRDLVGEWELLQVAGFRVERVAEQMSGAVNEFLADALRTGAEVPVAMRPMLEKMLEMGLLTDTAGEKLTDLEGITWAETLTQGFDRVVGAIERVVDMLGRNLPQVATTAAQSVQGAFDGIVTPAIDRADEALDAFLYGRSPGGMKEIPIKAMAASQAVKAMTESFVVDFRRAETSLGGLTKVFIESLTPAAKTFIETVRQIGEGRLFEPLSPSKAFIETVRQVGEGRPFAETLVRTTSGGRYPEIIRKSVSHEFGGVMAGGGAGIVRRPTWFLAGEAGPEEYAFSGAHRRFRDQRASEERPINFYFAIDRSGMRGVSKSEFLRMTQEGFDEGLLRVPMRQISSRAA